MKAPTGRITNQGATCLSFTVALRNIDAKAKAA